VLVVIVIFFKYNISIDARQQNFTMRGDEVSHISWKDFAPRIRWCGSLYVTTSSQTS
jgi:hypothetical protein